MKHIPVRFIPIVGAIFMFTAATGMAQEYFRDFGMSRSSSGGGRLSPGSDIFLGNDPYGFYSASEADLQQEEKNYNIRIGSFDLSLAVGAGFEFNDNITLADHNRISDVIFYPEFDLQGAIRFSESSRLRIGVGLSYAKYFDHSQFDSDTVLITPNSIISWTAESGPFKFTVRERFSYQEDPYTEPTLSNVPRYKRWENQAGIQIDWDASQFTKLSVGYDRYDLWAQDDFFESEDRGINTVFLRPSFQIVPTVSVGVSASVSFIDYRNSSHANCQTLLVGPFVKWRVSDYTDVYVEAGYQGSNFDGSTTVQFRDPVTGLPTGNPEFDTDDTDTIYVKLEVVNRPTDFLRQKLNFTKTSELGFNSNFYDLYHVEYTLEWAIQEKTSIRPSLFYEYYEASGPDAEKASRFGAALGIYHIFSQNLTLGLDYRFLIKDSNVPDADYYQNVGFVSLYYKF